MRANLGRTREAISFGKDEIVIQKYISGIAGGRTLDVTGFSGAIQAGHVIIKLGTGNYAPMPVSTTNGVTSYGSLPSGASYVGVLYRSILVSNPSASIMTNGEVNSVAIPYAMTSILTAFKVAVPHISWVSDESDSNIMAVAETAKTIAVSSNATVNISYAVGSVTATSDDENVTLSATNTAVAITVGSSATAGDIANITLTDSAGQTASIKVTVAAAAIP